MHADYATAVCFDSDRTINNRTHYRQFNTLLHFLRENEREMVGGREKELRR